MLTIDHLEKCFGSTVLFRDLTFTVDGPAVLWAPSGWGKTTLLRILMGLETPTAGWVQGAGRVSAVFQEDRLCPQLTAVQNVLLVLPDDRQEAAIRQDFARLGLDEAALTGAVTRQDAALLLCNALPEEYTPSFWDQPIDPTALSDWGRMDSLRQEAVAELARRCVIQGKADGSFGYADPLQRCDGAVLLMRVLEQVDNSCRGESQTVTLHILNADTGEALLPDQQVETEVSTYLSSLANGLDVGYYVYDYDRETASYTSTACDSYTLYFRPMTGAEIQEEQFWEKVERGEAAYEDYYKQDFWLNFQGDNARKHILLFGDESKSRFASQEEAAAAMTAVTVPVWQLSGGEKVSSTLTLSVHAALAEDVKEIFAEIYNDPEHFPIHDVGGYAWRGDSATGEHNCGTAIDINANENYQIRDGQVLAGSCWEPGSNAYSISPDSSVVRIFAEHGWSWGGDAWAYSSDDSEGYHDYMHFSYMGE